MTEKQIGDKITYAIKFLRSIGDYSYSSAQRRGIVVGFPEDKQYAQKYLIVKWDDEPDQTNWIVQENVIKVDDIHKEPA